jgi:hypothetical protein
VDTHLRQRRIGTSGVTPIYDSLASILGGLSPERRTAFAEYLDEQEQEEASNDGSNIEGTNSVPNGRRDDAAGDSIGGRHLAARASQIREGRARPNPANGAEIG